MLGLLAHPLTGHHRKHAMRARGRAVPTELVRHVAPLGWEHISLTGDYVWAADSQPAPDALRPLRARPSLLAA